MQKRVLACAIAFLLATGTGATAAADKDDVDKFFDNAGSTDYVDRSISVTRNILGFDLSLAYVDTDLSTTECGGSLCDARAVFTVSKSI